MAKPLLPPRDEHICAFPAIVATDSCSVWNILSSKTLTVAVKGGGPHLAITHFVRYECLEKPRSTMSRDDLGLQEKLRQELDQATHFSVHSLTVEDLSSVAQAGLHKKIDRGEIATMALAEKLVSGMLTDDYPARKAAENTLGVSRLRSTAHLVGWLIYGGRLSDGDVSQIIADNTGARNARGQIGPFIDICYRRAMELRLRDRGPA